jgi:hypothetical protein
MLLKINIANSIYVPEKNNYTKDFAFSKPPIQEIELFVEVLDVYF